MGGYTTFDQCGSVMVCQRRNALRRQSSSHCGSPFLFEMKRTVSSERPGGSVSVSISVLKPYWYSRLTSASMVELMPAPVPASCGHSVLATSAAVPPVRPALGTYAEQPLDEPFLRGACLRKPLGDFLHRAVVDAQRDTGRAGRDR